jgi:hypothetical protein
MQIKLYKTIKQLLLNKYIIVLNSKKAEKYLYFARGYKSRKIIEINNRGDGINVVIYYTITGESSTVPSHIFLSTLYDGIVKGYVRVSEHAD